MSWTNTVDPESDDEGCVDLANIGVTNANVGPEQLSRIRASVNESVGDTTAQPTARPSVLSVAAADDLNDPSTDRVIDADADALAMELEAALSDEYEGLPPEAPSRKKKRKKKDKHDEEGQAPTKAEKPKKKRPKSNMETAAGENTPSGSTDTPTTTGRKPKRPITVVMPGEKVRAANTTAIVGGSFRDMTLSSSSGEAQPRAPPDVHSVELLSGGALLGETPEARVLESARAGSSAPLRDTGTVVNCAKVVGDYADVSSGGMVVAVSGAVVTNGVGAGNPNGCLVLTSARRGHAGGVPDSLAQVQYASMKAVFPCGAGGSPSTPSAFVTLQNEASVDLERFVDYSLVAGDPPLPVPFIRLVGCTGVRIRSCVFRGAPSHAPAIHIESCTDVEIEGCVFEECGIRVSGESKNIRIVDTDIAVCQRILGGRGPIACLEVEGDSEVVVEGCILTAALAMECVDITNVVRGMAALRTVMMLNTTGSALLTVKTTDLFGTPGEISVGTRFLFEECKFRPHAPTVQVVAQSKPQTMAYPGLYRTLVSWGGTGAFRRCSMGGGFVFQSNASDSRTMSTAVVFDDCTFTLAPFPGAKIHTPIVCNSDCTSVEICGAGTTLELPTNPAMYTTNIGILCSTVAWNLFTIDGTVHLKFEGDSYEDALKAATSYARQNPLVVAASDAENIVVCVQKNAKVLISAAGAKAQPTTAPSTTRAHLFEGINNAYSLKPAYRQAYLRGLKLVASMRKSHCVSVTGGGDILLAFPIPISEPLAIRQIEGTARILSLSKAMFSITRPCTLQLENLSITSVGVPSFGTYFSRMPRDTESGNPTRPQGQGCYVVRACANATVLCSGCTFTTEFSCCSTGPVAVVRDASLSSFTRCNFVVTVETGAMSEMVSIFGGIKDDSPVCVVRAPRWATVIFHDCPKGDESDVYPRPGATVFVSNS
jgi:hypothetical protein